MIRLLLSGNPCRVHRHTPWGVSASPLKKSSFSSKEHLKLQKYCFTFSPCHDLPSFCVLQTRLLQIPCNVFEQGLVTQTKNDSVSSSQTFDRNTQTQTHHTSLMCASERQHCSSGQNLLPVPEPRYERGAASFPCLDPLLFFHRCLLFVILIVVYAIRTLF